MNAILTLTHRWAGVALALFMLGWISSGLLIAFVETPSIGESLRLSRAQSLTPRNGWLSLGEALQRSAAARVATPSNGRAHSEHPSQGLASAAPSQDAVSFAEARLRRVDETPAWIVEEDGGRRFAISAIDGGLIDVTPQRAERIANAWLEHEFEGGFDLSYLDTIDAPVGLRNAELLKPFHRFSRSMTTPARISSSRSAPARSCSACRAGSACWPMPETGCISFIGSTPSAPATIGATR